MQDISQGPYTPDGSDFRGALKHYYTRTFKRYGKYLLIFAPLFTLPIAFKVSYLWPVTAVGAIGTGITVIIFCSSLLWIHKCSRIFRRYPLQFREPVEKVELTRYKKLILTMGGPDGDDTSPVFLATDPVSRRGWPEGIADGVWFAGDDPFGGAALVPGSGELLFMQPKDWDATAKERAAAGEERTRKARRAGIKRHVPIR